MYDFACFAAQVGGTEATSLSASRRPQNELFHLMWRTSLKRCPALPDLGLRTTGMLCAAVAVATCRPESSLRENETSAVSHHTTRG